MSARCIGEPVSWLRLERYVLAELSGSEQAHVEAHLAACPACRACAEEARAPRRLPPLALPGGRSGRGPAEGEGPVRPPRRVLSRPRAAWIAWGGTALAAAAALLLALWPSAGEERRFGPDTVRVRGGEVSLTLVRERDGAIAENPEAFRTDDRFKVLLTCPPGHPGPFAVWVVQGTDVALALRESRGARCGNRVPLPGAFRITDPVEATVCVAWGPEATGGDGGVPTLDPRVLRSSAVCRTLRSLETP